MARDRTLEKTLAELAALRDDPTSDNAIATLKRVASSKSSHAVAKAAELAGEFEISELREELAAAFERFMQNPARSDKGCRAKAEIVKALARMAHDDSDLFLRGARHVQLEPVWGGKEDTAGDLRAASALGLVNMAYWDALTTLADLLADPKDHVRIAAARAIAHSGRDGGAPLLRLKARLGDDEPSVLGECLAALLELAPSDSIALGKDFLDDPDPAVVEAVLLAFGGSRLEGALPVLRDFFARQRDGELRRAALLGVAMLRRDAAIEFLVSLVAEAPGEAAREALEALATYRHDDALRERVERTCRERRDLDLGEALADAFQD